jgi:hypothetical protein
MKEPEHITFLFLNQCLSAFPCNAMEAHIIQGLYESFSTFEYECSCVNNEQCDLKLILNLKIKRDP